VLFNDDFSSITMRLREDTIADYLSASNYFMRIFSLNYKKLNDSFTLPILYRRYPVKKFIARI
jgi:hypothetical protein